MGTHSKEVVNECLQKLLVSYTKWSSGRKECVQILYDEAVNLKNLQSRCNIVSLFGSGTSAFGGLSFIVSLALAPLTGGLSTAFAGCAAMFSAVGKFTNVGNFLVDNGISINTHRKIEKLLTKDKEKTEELLMLIKLKQEYSDEENAFVTRATRCFLNNQDISVNKDTIKESGSIVIEIFDTVKGKVFNPSEQRSTCRSCGRHLNKTNVALFSKTAKRGLYAATGVSVAMDLWSMYSTISDLMEGSISEFASCLDAKAVTLAKGLDFMEEVMNELLPH